LGELRGEKLTFQSSSKGLPSVKKKQKTKKNRKNKKNKK